MNSFGRTLIFAGLILMVVGLLFTVSHKVPFLGKLPGDIRIEKENFSFYFPLTTCLILSALVSLILWLARR